MHYYLALRLDKERINARKERKYWTREARTNEGAAEHKGVNEHIKCTSSLSPVLPFSLLLLRFCFSLHLLNPQLLQRKPWWSSRRVAVCPFWWFARGRVSLRCACLQKLGRKWHFFRLKLAPAPTRAKNAMCSYPARSSPSSEHPHRCAVNLNKDRSIYMHIYIYVLIHIYFYVRKTTESKDEHEDEEQKDAKKKHKKKYHEESKYRLQVEHRQHQQTNWWISDD